MTTSDKIIFVKESRTCAYVLVVHTPRLCGEPGFMTNDAREQASISCREVITGELPDRSEAAFLPHSDHPLKSPRRKPVLPLPAPPAPGTTAKDGTLSSKLTTDAMLRKALGTIQDLKLGMGDAEMVEDEDGNILIQFYEDVAFGADDDIEAVEDAAAERLMHLLREAGMDVKGAAASKNGKSSKKKKNGDEKQDANDAADRRREVDEIL